MTVVRAAVVSRGPASVFSRGLMLVAALSLTACVDTTGRVPLSPKGDVVANMTPDGAGGGAFAQPQSGIAVPAPDGADAFAVSFLNALQPQSIAERREYCGYFFRTADGGVAATPARPGTFASCNMPAPRPGQGIFASYHTHGAFGREYDNEVPSVTDLQSDFSFGIDGYISTPGGRVWAIDNATRSARQICGLGCVFVDPGFVPVDESGVRQVYTVAGLQQR